MEGGYISEDLSTIVIITRDPYKRMILPFLPNCEEEYNKHVEKLRDENLVG